MGGPRRLTNRQKRAASARAGWGRHFFEGLPQRLKLLRVGDLAARPVGDVKRIDHLIGIGTDLGGLHGDAGIEEGARD